MWNEYLLCTPLKECKADFKSSILQFNLKAIISAANALDKLCFPGNLKLKFGYNIPLILRSKQYDPLLKKIFWILNYHLPNSTLVLDFV